MNAFGPLAARFVDASRGLASPRELAGYGSALPADGLVLDAMCGTGRVLVPWVRDGRKGHGVDASAAMLAVCATRLAEAAADVPLFRQDIAALNLPFRYAGALVAGGALQYLTDPSAVEAALARLHAHLLVPGVLVVEFEVPPIARQNLAAPLVEIATAQLPDGSRITLRSETTWTPEARLSRSERRYTQRRGAKRIGEEHEVVRATWYEPDEAVALFAAAGFAAEAVPSKAVEGEGTHFQVVAQRTA